ncbi:SMC5 [Auxenochlorella protothecoides x Auxenochlorella symbiontica]
MGEEPAHSRAAVRGAVLKVELKDFMTYKHAVFNPGPQLNLVLGPNGTGKSSLVCALCVGLGGKTGLLGRADEVSNYVRRGADKGWVKITLAGGPEGRETLIQRIMYSSKNSSDWSINGKECLNRDVQARVASLNIHLDNLCQFLPQDKVVEFARLNPQALLRATQASIGEDSLTTAHDRLIQGRKDAARLESATKALVESLDTLRAANVRAEPAVRALKRRKRLKEDIRLCGSKSAWLKHRSVERMLRDAEQESIAAADAVAELEAQIREETGTSKALSKEEAAADRVRTKAQRSLSVVEGKLNGTARGQSMLSALEELAANLAVRQRGIDGLEGEAAGWEARIAGLRTLIVQLEQEARAPQDGGRTVLAAEKVRLSRLQNDLQLQSRLLEERAVDAQHTLGLAEQGVQRWSTAVSELQDTRRLRLEELNRRKPGIARAAQWLEANRDRFRGMVLGPIAACVEVSSIEHAQALECHVTADKWTYFVVQHREDQDLLKQELQRQCGFDASIANFTGNPEEALSRPLGEAAHYARYGVTHSLDQVFESPALVKHFLQEESRLTEAFVGNSQAQEAVKEILAQVPRLTNLYTPKLSYRRIRSRYNASAESCSILTISAPRIFSPASLTRGSELEGAQASLLECQARVAKHQAELAAVRTAQQPILLQLEEVGKQYADVSEQLRGIHARDRNLDVTLDQKKRELARLAEQGSPLTRKPALEEESARIRAAAHALALDLAATLLKLGEAHRDVAVADLECKALALRMLAARQVSTGRIRQMDGLKQEAGEKIRRVMQLTRELEAVRQMFHEAYKTGDDALFAQFPDDLLELTEHQQTLETELAGLVITNPGAWEEYQLREDQIASQERELEGMQAQLSACDAELQSVQEQWLSRIRTIVDHINGSFQRNFASVGCAGEVVLRETEQDFEGYAVEIRVKFRESQQLETLDAHRQSGGERSVSTILYLIALQGITVAPFRVVDEINQGMDPINERKVYTQLVEAASRPGTPQCFLLTPKLLPGLPFNEAVTVLQIMNGPYITDVASSYSPDMLLGGRRGAAAAAQQRPPVAAH